MRSISQLDYVWFFTQVGLPQEASFFSEFIRRIQERFLPPLHSPQDVLGYIEDEVNDDREALVYTRLCSVDLQILRPALNQSLEILSLRISGIGLDPLIAKKWQSHPDYKSVFLQTPNHPEDLLARVRLAVAYVRSLREDEGTSIALTYKLHILDELTLRYEKVSTLLKHINAKEFPILFEAEIRSLVLQSQHSYKLRDFFMQNIEMLAYQITLLTSSTGENYISNNRQELLKMWWKAIKGAMIVAVLAFLKVLASKMSYPPLIQALLFGSIYAMGFVVIHLIGGVLATKQPAMTASTIAAKLTGAEESEESLRDVVEVIVRLLRTQIAALLGNYLFAFPLAIILVFPFLVIEHPIAGFEKAKILVEDLHPLWSPSFLFAAIAGVCLFLSGLIAGFADNWFSYQRIGERISKRIGGNRGERVATKVKRNFGIVTGNVILGFMLGSMSSIGRIIGLPLDIRHVTFASAAFGIGWIHQPERMAWSHFSVIAASIFIMGLVNLAVSFSLSLFVAMQSRRLQFHQGWKLVWMVVRRILCRPNDLFFDSVRVGPKK